jgi:hypothetical protein
MDVDILIPVFNDWAAVEKLLPAVDRVLATAGLSARVILIDDGSTVPPPERIRVAAGAVHSIGLLSLRGNLGHQRALATAIAWAAEHTSTDHVVLMDGDGEDDPADVPRLIARAQEGEGAYVVFAERTRRSERLLFRFFYNLYRVVHRLMTGIPVRVGNFSVIPRRLLPRLTIVPELWSHYAAAVFRARIPRQSVPTTRAARLDGNPRMNFAALVIHGLRAMTVHADVVCVRVLIACSVAALAASAALAGLFALRLFSPSALPNGATLLMATLLVLIVQVVGLAVSFVFVSVGAQSGVPYIPARDYRYFVDGFRPLTLTIGSLATEPESAIGVSRSTPSR